MGVRGSVFTKVNHMNYIEIQKRNSRFREELKKKPTKQEKVFKEFLDKEGIKYIFQKGFLKPYHRICDFYIKKYRLIVEIDGGYHTNFWIQRSDERKDQVWSRFKTLRLLNSQIDDGSYINIWKSIH